MLAYRWTPEVYCDILRAIHRIERAGKRVSLYSVGQKSQVPVNRLKNRLSELRMLGLLNNDFSITPAGYGFCEDYTKSVERFLSKYRLHR